MGSFTIEQPHTITLHARADVWEWSCRCGEGGVDLPRVAKAKIMGHRMEKIPAVREALAR